MKKLLKTYFIPYGGNEYRPHILQKTAVTVMGVMVLLTFTLANLHALFWINSNWLVSAILPAVVVDLTNVERGGTVASLQRNETLDRAATLKAEHMAKHGYFAHFAPDGTSPWYFFDSVSYNYMHAGENLAVHFADSDEVVEAWMNSPTHRENIMSGKYTEIGVGTARGTYEGHPTVFVVQLFGTPMPQTLAVAPEVAEVAAPAPVPAPVAEPVSTPAPAAVELPTVAPVEVTVPPVVEVAVVTPEEVSEVPPTVEPTPVAVADSAPAPAAVTAPAANEVAATEIAETSREVAVAGIEFARPAYAAERDPVSSVAKIATQPQRLLNFVYAVTSVFVFFALMVSVMIEIRRQHPVQIAYGTGLIATMMALLYIHTYVTGGALVV